MALSNQELWEAATKIRERLKTLRVSRYAELSTKLMSLLGSMERLRAFENRLRICTSRNWFHAAAEVTSSIANNFGWLTRDINLAQDIAGRLDTPIPSLGELTDELRQAEREFGQLCYDRKAQTLGATTEAIELEEVFLGEFEIRLLLADDKSHDLDDVCHIVALDPHPAASDDAVTHPHVKDEALCAGDAGAAIRSALAQGRICDFFLLIKSVLSEYNSASPYVALANWESGACYDCGYSFGSANHYTCPACENDFCSECISYCRRCESDCCEACLTTCIACDESVCPGCITRCPDCRRAICKNCLEENRCPCQKEKEKDDESADPTAAAAAAI